MNRLLEYLKKRYVQWDYDKYWSSREALFDKKTNKIKYFFCKAYVSKMNRVMGASIAYDVSRPDNFKGRPILGHELKGIVIAAGAIIGENCFISHQVTIGRSRGGAPVIGNNVRIGANAVVFQDIPDNATVVLPKPRIIIKEEGYRYSPTLVDTEKKE